MSQLCYFDYAATTPVRGEVIAAMTAALEQFGNPSSRYPYGAQAAKRVKEDRATVAQALGCALSNSLGFGGHNATLAFRRYNR